MDVTTFRTNFAEFGNTATYPDYQINFWIGVGGRMLNTTAWGNMLDDGISLFTAHHISLAAQNSRDAGVGGQPGQNKGPVSSKGVDKVNIAYDTGAAIEAGAGHWNLTTYGTQFIRLAKLLGAGAIQVSGNCGPYIAPGGFPFDPFTNP